MKLITEKTPFGRYRRWMHKWEEPDTPNGRNTKHVALSEFIRPEDDEETVKRIGILFTKRIAKKSPFAAKSLPGK